MACFTAPATVGILITFFGGKIPEKYHINWLNTLLKGGVIGLALEHVAHGEIVPYPPFLTAMANPVNTGVMIHEILTIGVGMTLACVATWIILVRVSSIIEAKTKAISKQTT